MDILREHLFKADFGFSDLKSYEPAHSRISYISDASWKQANASPSSVCSPKKYTNYLQELPEHGHLEMT